MITQEKSFNAQSVFYGNPVIFCLKAMIFSFSAQKIQRRLSSLKAMPWSVEKKKEIEKAVGSMDYTSSDESDWSEDENGESRHAGFLVKKLPWERTCLKNVKQRLDEAYIRGLNQRARQNLAVRRVHRLPST